ncbi:serine/threonine-protein kinase [Pseudarthrobacter sp. NamB4]|uniref:serine/threonine-protein kinase n=1 Tax=Pseudarthrobacter sp. NamB4 TaxID=2576837 RepID=UPI0010FDCB5F|nr:serine/threonine-protein kinase [Pseudarthrobacter sp. NamB4]TLM73279.1 serine/threonine protein kinase [Pseudarthrobacter sp. NamB4]
MVAESPSSIKNEVVGGRYRLGEVIGRGGMSSVYCARDEKLGRDVALKLFAPQAPDADELKRQEAEIQLLATLNHPGLVTLFDAGIDTRIPDEPRPFLTMELVEGQDLRSRIRHSTVPLEELAVIGAGIADALAYVHGLGVIHRDIKPGNILLVQIRPGEPLRPKLTDFGIARIVDSTRLTATGTMVGTAAYLSPEQALGQPLSPATDIYSFGLVLLECIKGTVEYPGSAVESAVARLHRAPEVPDDVPSEWADLIRSMTAIEPLERPAAADIETVLRQALVSPASTPGELAPETTRVLPAMPFHPPSITAEESVDEMREAAGPDAPLAGALATASPAAVVAQVRAKDSKRRTKRFWLTALMGLVVVAAAVAALMMTLSTQATPDVVPYPTVTGVLGEHLEELQKSVEP